MNNTLYTSSHASRAFSARTTLAAALVALACSGCAEMMQAVQEFDNAVAVALGGQPVYKSAGGAISGEITSAKALQFIYGSKLMTMSAKEAEGILGDEACTEWVPWKPPADSEYFDEEMFGNNTDLKGKTAAVCKVLDGRYTAGGVEKYIMFTETKYMNDENACKLCGPIVGAFVFAKDGGQWKLEMANKEATYGGAFGNSGLDEKLVRVGSEIYGVLDTTGFSGVGGGETSIGVVMPYKNAIKYFSIHQIVVGTILASIESESNLEVGFDESSGGEYYDALVSYVSTLTNRKGDVVRERVKTKRFRFVNGEYKEVKAAKKSSKKTSTKKRK